MVSNLSMSGYKGEDDEGTNIVTKMDAERLDRISREDGRCSPGRLKRKWNDLILG